MTNPYFDQAKASPYEGGFEICHRCVTVVPTAYKERHRKECIARHEAAERVDEQPVLQVDDVTSWDEGDPTA